MLVSPHHLVEEGEEELANEHRVGSVSSSSSSSKVVLGCRGGLVTSANVKVAWMCQ